MCIRNLIIALAVATVSGRPQVPQSFQQQTSVSMQLNSDYSDPTSLPEQSRVLGRTENKAHSKLCVNAGSSRGPANPTLDNSQSTAKTIMNNQLTRTESNLHNQQLMNTNPVLNYPTYQGAPAHTNCTMQNNEKITDEDQEIREGKMTTIKNQAENTQTIYVNQQNLPVNNAQTTMTSKCKLTPINTTNNQNEMNESHIIYRSDQENPDQNIKAVIFNKNDSDKRSSNRSLESKRVLASGPAYSEPQGPNYKSTDIEDDRQIWGYSDGVTEKVDQATTPDVLDRASFDGGTCPSGKVKVLGKCVDED